MKGGVYRMLTIEQSVNVIDSLNKGLRLTPEEQQFFCEHFEREEIKKNEFTIRIGDYEKYLYFIESGILRYWTAQEYGDPDKEITFWFSFPGEFANSYFSLKENQPSLIHIQALTDCVIWKLSKLDLADLYQTSLNINKIARIEIMPEEFPKLLEKNVREDIAKKFKEYGFTYVTMDILGYRMGSMNETLGENDKTTADSSLKGKNE